MAVLEPGHTLGRYRLEDLLGAGGMGEVYRAWDDVLRRWVALKVVPLGDPRAQRLVGEARAVAALHHPHIVAVHDVGEAGEFAFVSMELVEGKPLRDFIADSSVSLETQLAWLLQIASALRAAHKSGIVHRDIKPDNVMITKDDQARVLDFGLAKAFGVDVEAPTEHGAPVDTFRTAEGRVSGTPAYMAPEQLAGGPPAPGWDQYAWGVLACELLTGKHPRIAGLIGVSGRVKPESLAHVPPAIADVVSRAMSPVADERFPSMDAVSVALGAPPSAPSIARNVSNARADGRTTTPAPGPATASNMAIGDTLQVPVHPNAPAPQQAKPRRALFIVLGVVVLGSVAFAAWRFRATPIVAAPIIASTTSVASSIAPIVSAAPSITESAAPPSSSSSVAVITTAPPPIVHPRKLNVFSRGNPTPSYDEAAVARGVAGARFGIKSCVEQNPPAKVPHSFAISLELWNGGPQVGEVRDVRVSEPAPLAKCLRDGLMGMSFGPSKTNFPPGAVFITVNVD